MTAPASLRPAGRPLAAKRGHIGVQVRLSSELWPGMRPDSHMAVKTEIVTTYEPLVQFSRELMALVRGPASEAVLLGEEI